MKILHVAHALPSKKVTNQDLIEEMLSSQSGKVFGLELKELQQRMQLSFRFAGTEVRYHRAEGEKAFTIGMRAGQLALERSGVPAADVDLLIYAGVGRGWLEPAMANIFQAELGLSRATCFDVLDACASWIRSLQLAKALITAGTYRTVMILNCELNFREYANFEIERMEDLEYAFSAFTIGEAATATLLVAEPERDDFVLSFRTRATSGTYATFRFPTPTTLFRLHCDRPVQADVFLHLPARVDGRCDLDAGFPLQRNTRIA